MSDDIRLSTGFFTHHKTIKLERRFGLIGVKSLINLWMWTAQNRPTGILEGMTEEDLEIASAWPDVDRKLIPALVELHWLDVIDGVYHVHGWAENQPWIIGAGARKEKARKANAKRWGSEDVLPQASSEDTPRTPKRDSEESPSPFPSFPKEKDISGGPAVPIDPKAFSGFVIYHQDGEMRINNRDFESWKSAYSHLDIPAQLQSLSDWTRETREWTKKDAFHRTSAALRIKDDKARIYADEKSKDQAAQKDKKLMTIEERKRAEWLASGQAVN